MVFSAESVTSAILRILNTDTDVVVCFFLDSFFSYLYALLIITRVSFWERKLMTTRHELGRLVLEVVPLY